MLTELDFEVLELLEIGRVTPAYVQAEIGDYTYQHVRSRLEELREQGLVRRPVEDVALYEITEKGVAVGEWRREYEARDDVSQAEFYHQLESEVLSE